MLTRAKQRLNNKIFRVDSYAVMKAMIEKGSGQAGVNDEAGFYLVPWKCDADNEKAIKEECKATIRCYPFEYNANPPQEGVKCFYSGEQATHMAIFARAF
jgi:prolyl-tRNA synthetase